MRLPNELNREIQIARALRGVAVITELAAIYFLIWGVYTGITTVIGWF